MLEFFLKYYFNVTRRSGFTEGGYGADRRKQIAFHGDIHEFTGHPLCHLFMEAGFVVLLYLRKALRNICTEICVYIYFYVLAKFLSIFIPFIGCPLNLMLKLVFFSNLVIRSITTTISFYTISCSRANNCKPT